MFRPPPKKKLFALGLRGWGHGVRGGGRHSPGGPRRRQRENRQENRFSDLEQMLLRRISRGT